VWKNNFDKRIALLLPNKKRASVEARSYHVFS
jgi:hypothetical protein